MIRYFSARIIYSESSPAVQYFTVMKRFYENYSLKATAFTAEERFLKSVLKMITKMLANNQAYTLLVMRFLLFFIFLIFTVVSFQCIDPNSLY